MQVANTMLAGGVLDGPDYVPKKSKKKGKELDKKDDSGESILNQDNTEQISDKEIKSSQITDNS